jgi:3',5'-cyclic AMP phosphodiesterase CpdA
LRKDIAVQRFSSTPRPVNILRSGWHAALALLSASAALGGCAVQSDPDAKSSVVSITPTAAIMGAPLLFAPTPSSFGISVVLTGGDPKTLAARVRAAGELGFGPLAQAEVMASDLAEWTISGLKAGTRYEYEIVEVAPPSGQAVLYQGSAVTARPEGEPFTFALLSDSHIGAHLEYGNQGDENVLKTVCAAIDTVSPDFMVNLGDMLDYHEYGFNAPPPDGSISRLAYHNYRTWLGDMSGRTPHFPVIGNWEGENGEFPPEAIAWSREQRMLYMPTAGPGRYPEGGSPYQDYYAFTWSDALFVVLNVMTYTPTPHLLSSNPGLPDDWTLGPEQLAWLETTLRNATSKWRFVLIHHAVGGAAGDAANSAYGRGGGQAARVGEQATVHQLMLDHGVQIFFYGHDHVFTDMTVDGIHYTAPGSAGAPWMFSQVETGYTQSWLEAGWGRVDVTPESVHVSFISINGSLLYEYTVQ